MHTNTDVSPWLRHALNTSSQNNPGNIASQTSIGLPSTKGSGRSTEQGGFGMDPSYSTVSTATQGTFDQSPRMNVGMGQMSMAPPSPSSWFPPSGQSGRVAQSEIDTLADSYRNDLETLQGWLDEEQDLDRRLLEALTSACRRDDHHTEGVLAMLRRVARDRVAKIRETIAMIRGLLEDL